MKKNRCNEEKLKSHPGSGCKQANMASLEFFEKIVNIFSQRTNSYPSMQWLQLHLFAQKIHDFRTFHSPKNLCAEKDNFFCVWFGLLMKWNCETVDPEQITWTNDSQFKLQPEKWTKNCDKNSKFSSKYSYDFTMSIVCYSNNICHV